MKKISLFGLIIAWSLKNQKKLNDFDKTDLKCPVEKIIDSKMILSGLSPTVQHSVLCPKFGSKSKSVIEALSCKPRDY